MAITSMQAMETKIRKGANRQSEGGEPTQATQSSERGLTQGEAEKLINNLVKETWLERSNEGFYTLSPRALLELRSWLVESYNDADDDADSWQRIKFCEACKEIVTIGQRCTERDCNVRLHNICTAAFWNSRPDKKCPKCNAAWTGKAYVGQKAITSTEEYLKGKRRSGGKRKNDVADEGEEDEVEGEGSNRRRGRHQAVEEESSPEAEDTPMEDEGDGINQEQDQSQEEDE